MRQLHYLIYIEVSTFSCLGIRHAPFAQVSLRVRMGYGASLRVTSLSGLSFSFYKIPVDTTNVNRVKHPYYVLDSMLNRCRETESSPDWHRQR